MSSAPTADAIARDATWLVQALDPASRLVRLVRMDAGSYRSASFLDDRMTQQPIEAQLVPWDLARSASELVQRRDARWIFHIGHVGSTLVARLLGEIARVLSVREPRFLRDLAAVPQSQRGQFTSAAQRLFSRSFAPDEAALVKATSFVSEIADELVPQGQRALFMFATPRNYVASILAGENSVKELSALAPSRAQRVAARAQLPQPASQADLAAIAWACEMTALEAAAERMAGRELAWMDFDSMLGDTPAELARVADFFGFDTSAIAAIANGPLMGRYSKATEYEYTPSLRRDLIAEAGAASRADIDSALSMLQSAAENSPLLARALDRAKES